jgi:D-arabinose 1-dehydrogenase-like Zn-dependent alcohol dehydrogenase
MRRIEKVTASVSRAFSSGQVAMIETVPLEKAPDGFARMIEGKARFRMVLVTKNGMAQTA